MQNSQVQLFRPPIPVRRSYAIGVMEGTLGFGLRCFFVLHISLSVLGDVSHTPRLLEIFGMHPALRNDLAIKVWELLDQPDVLE